MILVTGGLGYIGSFTLKLLSKKRAISIDNFSRGNKFAEKYCLNISTSIQNKKELTKIFRKYKINTVLHLAAFTCVRESKKNPKIYKKNNWKNQKIFLNHVIKLGVKKIIFASSYSVQGYNNNIKEKFSPYARYKFLIEKYLKKISKIENIKIIILRYPNIAGASINGQLGEKNDKISRIFPTFYKNIIKNKKMIIYYDFKKKMFPSRSYVHIEDIAKLNIKAINFINKMTKKFLLININNKIKYSNKQIFDFMFNKLKKGKFVIKKINKIEKINPLYINDNNYLKKLKWRPKNSSIEKIINTNLKWYKKIYVK